MTGRLVKYLQGSLEEMKKVSWPTKKETKNYTLLVIGVSLSVAVFLGALDYAFSRGIEILLATR